jgi:ribosomal protein S16
MWHGFLLDLRSVLGQARGPRKGKLAGELGNYAPEKERVQEKIKKFEYLP